MQVLATTVINANAVLAQNKHRQSCGSLLHAVMQSSHSSLQNNLTRLSKRLLALRPYWQCQPCPLLSAAKRLHSGFSVAETGFSPFRIHDETYGRHPSTGRQ